MNLIDENTETNSTNVFALALSNNTRIAYEKGWHCFQMFCESENIEPLSATPDEVAEFLIEIATNSKKLNGKCLSFGTITLYRSAINRKYLDAELVSPTNHPKVNSVMKGLARMKGNRSRQVKALREKHIMEILSYCDVLSNNPKKRLICYRDAAIIAIGFSCALRRSEICNLCVDDIEFIEQESSDVSRKMFLHIRKSKTDQDGCGQKIAVLEGNYIKPIERLMRWLTTANLKEGYLFQTMRRGGNLRGRPMHHSDISRLVKNYTVLIGLDSKDFSAHSLRAGFVTSAAVHHARLDKIMEITRHRNPSTVLKYIRDVDCFTDHAGSGFL